MKSFLSNKAYDILSWIALVALDAVGTFYKSIAMIWHLPYGNEVLASCTAISVLIGILIGVSKVDYQKKLNQTIAQVGKEVQEMTEEENDVHN